MLEPLLVCAAAVSLTIIIHYEVLYRLSKIIPRVHIKHRYRILIGVAGTLCAHVLEVGLFALGYYVLVNSGEHGSLAGNFDGSLLDCVYFSFATYTSLGFGDIEPFGALRFLTGIEALVGLAMITWSASFMYLEMQKYWDRH